MLCHVSITRWSGWASTLRMPGECLRSTTSTSECFSLSNTSTSKLLWTLSPVLLRSGLDDFRQASVSQSDHTALCLPPGTGCAPATLSCCWCQPGLLIRSWRMWQPSAPGRGFRPWFTGQELNPFIKYMDQLFRHSLCVFVSFFIYI